MNETKNNNVRREKQAVLIENNNDTLGEVIVVTGRDSEDSAICLKNEDTNSETSASPPSLDPAPAPGMSQLSS